MRWNLDLRFPLLKFSNEWYYFLSGRRFEYEEGREVAFVMVDALVGEGEYQVLYSGILHDYFLGRDGSLDMISIAVPRKTLLGKMQFAKREGAANPKVPETGSGTTVPGDFFILKYGEVKNLNVVMYEMSAPQAATEAEDSPEPGSQPE